MTIIYEWCISEIDKHGDIVNVDYFNTLNRKHKYIDIECLSLVCRELSDGTQYYSDASIEANELPEYLLDAYNTKTRKIPKRFHNQLRNFIRLCRQSNKSTQQ